MSRGKMDAEKFQGEKYPALKKISLMTYNAEKIKSYPFICWGKNSKSREVWEKILPIQCKLNQ